LITRSVHPRSRARHHFLIVNDCRVFAADAGAGATSKQRVARYTPGQRRSRRVAVRIKAPRDEEQFLAADPIGGASDPESAEARRREINGVLEKIPTSTLTELQVDFLSAHRTMRRPA